MPCGEQPKAQCVSARAEYQDATLRQTSRLALGGVMLVLGALSGACGLDWGVNDATGNTGFPDASNDSPTGPNDGGPSGPPRSCSRSRGCYYDEYCDYGDGKCGSTSEGICTQRPATCGEAGPPQCGCDGKRYTMACEAHRAGLDDAPDACPSDAPEYFSCGTQQCKVGQEYCQASGGLLTPRVWACKPFSATCAVKNCACARTTDVCLGTCSEVPGGGSFNDCSL